ncbi:MAG: F0F1 ATP synthase subunit delta [Paracoccaceae bacterium]
MDVSEPISISTGIAARYATAIFELAMDDNNLNALESDISNLEEALKSSDDFVALINSPIYTREQQGDAIVAISKEMQLSTTVSNSLALMATNRRLFVLPQLMAGLRTLIADQKGEITAEVTSAIALTEAQQDKLAKSLKSSVGKDVKINMAVDESLIGGLIVKVGSKMIDTTIASKLANLQNVMKEVG